MSDLDGILGFPGPWQQFGEPVCGIAIGHTLEDIGEVGVGLDAVQFCRFDQRAEDRPAVCSAIAAGEQMVLASERDGPDRALDRVGIKLDAAIVEESGEAFPAAEGVADGFGAVGFVEIVEDVCLGCGHRAMFCDYGCQRY